ncbi:acetoin utilization protein AcuC [Corynebacterium felinum]|uniref:Acetoin utilization protein AcuC n=1 Tax=Corynebacterium felinum TaxID=131318 RepID=A0ABU2B9X8_9CORY|nr:acetoin utilization protein AcuC [Corynebacterium felinum]MDF5820411.1 acetoin utilization protein AcuC [Corynebacterium felinum]MDR7355447.1 acetoin utilization protein AcuC [Corynebacterium felinum]WJY94798.1 Acetoin utilization protein AcuC [Corynebacterium felinum]
MKPLLLHTAELLEYSFGEDHPMGPDRVRVAMELAQHFGVLELFDIAEPPLDCAAYVASVHCPDYIQATIDQTPDLDFGIGDHEHPLTPGLAPIAARVVGATVAAVQAVWNGTHARAVNLSGGLHHATFNRQSGFCMYNDAAAAIRWLLDQGATRVCYLDLDAHHGDGVEAMFWNDPRVLTISAHESGLYLFPYTGFSHDIGGPDAAGTAVNIAFPRHTRDVEWLQAVHGIVPQILSRFRPEIIISQHGADPHRNDPLADLELSIDAMALAYRSVAGWAQKYAKGKWVAIGGGGYNRDSVGRAWTQLLCAVAGVELPADATLPAGWEQRVRCDSGLMLGDAGAAHALADFSPERRLTVQPCAPMVATSRSIFPYWGLNPYPGH